MVSPTMREKTNFQKSFWEKVTIYGLVQPGFKTNDVGRPTDPCPRKGERGKGREMGLKTKQWQWSEEEN